MDYFDDPYWNIHQVIAWVYTGDRALVGEVAERDAPLDAALHLCSAEERKRRNRARVGAGLAVGATGRGDERGGRSATICSARSACGKRSGLSNDTGALCS